MSSVTNQQKTLFDGSPAINPLTFKVDIYTPDSGEFTLSVEGIKSFYIIEDLEQMFRTGKIVFKDIDYLHEYLPFTGNEKIKIEIKQGGRRKTINFDIFKVESIEGNLDGNPTEYISLHLIEKGWYELFTSKPAIGFKEKKTTEIIKFLISNYTNIENINVKENSLTTLPLFIMPLSWTIRKSIKYLLEKSVSENGGWGWLVWMDGEGKPQFNIETIENIVKKTKIQPEPDGFLFFKSSNPYSTELILSYVIHPIDKFMLMDILGGGTFYSIDRDKKNLSIYSTDLKSEIENLLLMGSKSLFTKDYQDKNAAIYLNYWGEDKNIAINIHRNKFVKNYFTQLKTDVITYGRVDRKLGDILDVRWLSKITPNSQEGKKNPYNTALQGRWILKAITHFYDVDIKGVNYLNKLSLCRNAYNKIDYSTLISSKRV